jgi:hypothetical protein
MAGLYKTMSQPNVVASAAWRGADRRVDERRNAIDDRAMDAGAERRMGERRIDEGPRDMRYARSVPLR